MAGNRPVLDIEIDDSAFQQFKRQFDAYSAAVKALPEHWQLAGAEIDRQKSSFEKMFQKLESQGQASKGALIEQTQFNKVLDATELTWGSLAKSGKQFAGHIHSSTQQLMRWTKLTAVFSGLLGGGGLYGIARSATSAAGQRTSAGGLGVSIGEQSSFLTNFGRLGNAESILSGFSQGLANPVGRAQIGHLLGHTPTGDAADTAAEALPKFKAFVDKADPHILGTMLEKLGYTKLGLGLDRANIVKRLPREEVERLSKSYLTDKTGMGLDDKVAKKWTDFSTQMERAGWQIENVFAKGLVGLAPRFEDLSKGLGLVVEDLMKDGAPLIKDIADRLESFNAALGSKDFMTNVDKFSNDCATVVRIVEKLGSSGSLGAIIGTALAARFAGPGAVRVGAGLAGAVSGAALAGAGALAAGGLAVTTSPLNAGEDELARQRRRGIGDPVVEDERARQRSRGIHAPGSNAPSPNGSPASSPAGHAAPSQGGGTPRNLYTGRGGNWRGSSRHALES
jgi:hypothetical protein